MRVTQRVEIKSQYLNILAFFWLKYIIMSKKILVLGDSFATIDPEHGHWASLWADQHEYEIKHLGYQGRDHLYIINDFYNLNLFGSFDMLIYQVTDFYRIQHQYPPLNVNEVVDKLIDLSYFKNSSSSFFEKLASVTTPTALPMHMLQMLNLPALEAQTIRQLYSSISIDWLVSANYFIMRNLMLECKLKGIPLVIVIDQHLMNIDLTIDLFDEYDNVFRPKVDELTLDESSINHVSKHGHNLALESFNSFVQEKSLFNT